MAKQERYLMFSLLFISILLSGFKFYRSYLAETIIVPTNGGEYIEAISGEVKYLNPILAQTDAEKSISHLMFSGLIKVSADGSIVPELAEKYEISPDGKKYTFFLRKDVKFADGSPLTAQDVAFTIDSIKAPELKSPLNKRWVDIKIDVPDEYTISMDLPNTYGPFIYNCDFGVLPATVSSSDFSRNPIGSGVFKFVKVLKKADKITEIKLENNSNYFGEKPFLKDLSLKIYPEKGDAGNLFDSDKANALFGESSQLGSKYDFKSSRKLGLVLNMRNEKLKDKALRQKIVEGQKIEEGLKLGLTTLDAPLQHEKAEELKKNLASQNIALEIFYFNQIKFQDVLAAKNYELLLYGFDFGYDRDPYPFWHSSQLDSQNFAGWSDKNSDILLEDARMLTDNMARNAKYDQFFESISREYLIQFFDPISYNFRVDDEVKDAQVILGTQPYSRYDNISKWYMKEKRVKKN
jgi:ABC-type transport system substrate-binding protein